MQHKNNKTQGSMYVTDQDTAQGNIVGGLSYITPEEKHIKKLELKQNVLHVSRKPPRGPLTRLCTKVLPDR